MQALCHFCSRLPWKVFWVEKPNKCSPIFCFQGEKVLQNDEFTRDLFRFLQLLCEGHNSGKWNRLICQRKTTFRCQIMIQLRMPHLIQPAADSRTAVNPFLNKELDGAPTWTSGLMLFSATQAELLPESSDGASPHPPLSVRSLGAHKVHFLALPGWEGSGQNSVLQDLPGPKQGALVRLFTQYVSSEFSQEGLLSFLGVTSAGSDPALVFLDFQNFLRTQMGNTTTVNVIISTVDYLLRLQVSGSWTVAWFTHISRSLRRLHGIRTGPGSSQGPIRTVL